MIEREKVLLLERFPDEVKTEIINNTKIKGGKVYRILKRVDDTFTEIALYNEHEDKTDLSGLSDKIGYFLCSVEKDKYNQFHWIKYSIDNYHEENDKQYLEISSPIECDEDECKLLNDIFPEYFKNAY